MSRSYKPLDTSADIFDVYVLIEPALLYFSDTDLDNALEWVFKGGRLIYLESFTYWTIDDEILYRTGDPGVYSHGYTLYSYGMGEIITGDAYSLLNQNLMENGQSGAEFTAMLDRWDVSTLCFNESIHGFINTGNAWYLMPEVLKLLTYEIVILAVLIIWRLGKRFGNTVPYYEEVEREENEHVKALANIYSKAGATEIVLSNYKRRFLERCSHAFHVSVSDSYGNLYGLWREASLPHLDLLAKIPAEDTRVSAKKLKYHLKNIRTCEKVLSERGKICRQALRSQ